MVKRSSWAIYAPSLMVNIMKRSSQYFPRKSRRLSNGVATASQRSCESLWKNEDKSLFVSMLHLERDGQTFLFFPLILSSSYIENSGQLLSSQRLSMVKQPRWCGHLGCFSRPSQLFLTVISVVSHGHLGCLSSSLRLFDKRTWEFQRWHPRAFWQLPCWFFVTN